MPKLKLFVSDIPSVLSERNHEVLGFEIKKAIVKIPKIRIEPWQITVRFSDEYRPDSNRVKVLISALEENNEKVESVVSGVIERYFAGRTECIFLY